MGFEFINKDNVDTKIWIETIRAFISRGFIKKAVTD